MLMGLVTKNAILLVDFNANQARARGLRTSRRGPARGRHHSRCSPILMTTLAMVFGMLPLALGLGEGASGQRAPMAHAVIGGLISSTAAHAARRARAADLHRPARPVGNPAFQPVCRRDGPPAQASRVKTADSLRPFPGTIHAML
jgi:hypothetical protein